jgi:hypothetical protein
VRMTRTWPARGALLGRALVTAALFGGSAGAAPAAASVVTPKPVPACSAVQGPGPGYNASVGTAQDGKTVCITVGEKLVVFLSAPVTTGLAWAPIEVAPKGVLTPAPLTLMLPRNVRAENFLATRPGRVELSSDRPACSVPRGSQVSCGAILLWEVKVAVTTPSKGELPPVTVKGRTPLVGVARG